ncbi:hypothetical protein ABLB84_10370, partial [Xenorhabdus szentirmaii]|uniref:hypothetical protein n=1 Tax=Xenorhabdus szentirmaii TaxID=290112 RepID=UPI0032B721F6
RFSLTSLGGMSQLSVGQWWRIIGRFLRLAIVFLKKTFKRSLITQNNLNRRFIRLRKEKRGEFSTSFYL